MSFEFSEKVDSALTTYFSENGYTSHLQKKVPSEIDGVKIIQEEKNISFEIEFEGRIEKVLLRGESMEISWPVYVIGHYLYEVPWVQNVISVSHTNNAKQTAIKALLLRKMGVVQKKITLPEKVVRDLPIPSWAEPYPEGPDDYSNAGIRIRYRFVSEAKESITKFKEELGDYERGLESL